jgi:hypothetical protein
VQLLSTTDPAEAHLDFVQTRLGGVDTTHMQILLDAPALPTSDPNAPSDSPSWISQHWLAIAIAAGAGAVGLTVLIIALIFYRRRQRRLAKSKVYQSLAAPAPAGEMAQVAGYGPRNGVYAPGHYRDASHASTIWQGDSRPASLDLEYDKAPVRSNYANPWEPHDARQ